MPNFLQIHFYVIVIELLQISYKTAKKAYIAIQQKR